MDVTIVEVPTLSRVLDDGRSSRACAVPSSVRLPVFVIFNARTDANVKESDRMRDDCAWRLVGGGLGAGEGSLSTPGSRTCVRIVPDLRLNHYTHPLPTKLVSWCFECSQPHWVIRGRNPTEKGRHDLSRTRVRSLGKLPDTLRPIH